MGFTCDADEEVEEIKKNSGGGLCSEGLHHVMVIEAEEFNDHAAIKWQVLAGPDQGKKIYDRFYFQGSDAQKSAMCKKRILKACFALDYLNIDEYNAAKAKGESIDIEFGDWLDLHCVVDVKHRKYKDKDGNDKLACDTGFAIYSPFDKEARGCILDRELCPDAPEFEPEPEPEKKAEKKGRGNGRKNGAAGTFPAPAPPPPKAPVSTPANYDDL